MTEKAESKKSDSDPAGSGAERDKPSLEDLLASYGKGDGDEQPAKAADAPPDAMDRIAKLEQELLLRDFDKEMNENIIPKVRGDLDLDDTLVKGYVNQRATDDPRLMEVWDKRKSDPKAFEDMLGALSGELAEKFGSSSDAGRAVNAVRKSRESTPSLGGFDNVDWAGMSDSDFELRKREVYKAAEKGQLR